MAHGNQQRTCEPRPATDESTQFGSVPSHMRSESTFCLYLFTFICGRGWGWGWILGTGVSGVCARYCYSFTLVFSSKCDKCILWISVSALCSIQSHKRNVFFFFVSLIHSFLVNLGFWRTKTRTAHAPSNSIHLNIVANVDRKSIFYFSLTFECAWIIK